MPLAVKRVGVVVNLVDVDFDGSCVVCLFVCL